MVNGESTPLTRVLHVKKEIGKQNEAVIKKVAENFHFNFSPFSGNSEWATGNTMVKCFIVRMILITSIIK